MDIIRFLLSFLDGLFAAGSVLGEVEDFFLLCECFGFGFFLLRFFSFGFFLLRFFFSFCLSLGERILKVLFSLAGFDGVHSSRFDISFLFFQEFLQYLVVLGVYFALLFA